MPKILVYETPIGTFVDITIAEQKLEQNDMPKNMIKCILMEE